mmetsp:Transcript_2008/g.4226  ORF Transcript_2008/g.4226 Transcript_2008/m.4226 type:complete len:94 (+) Transcript_2008:950-1231(+)
MNIVRQRKKKTETTVDALHDRKRFYCCKEGGNQGWQVPGGGGQVDGARLSFPPFTSLLLRNFPSCTSFDTNIPQFPSIRPMQGYACRGEKAIL